MMNMLLFFFPKENAGNNISNTNDNYTNFNKEHINISEGKNQVNRITLVNMFICALDYLL